LSVETKTITIRLKLFSVAKDLAGFGDKVIELPADSQSDMVLGYLVRQNPLFERWKSSLRIAVNMEYVEHPRQLREGDEVAVIPPVSGG
jgi:molybdopterin converting factor small subunit